MSNFIHSREYLKAGDTVRLDCDTQCNFRITTDSEFSSFRRGGACRYYGGFYKSFPAAITAPHSGYWNVIIDLGGGRANIRYDLTVIKD
jgi:hypothetical protein